MRVFPRETTGYAVLLIILFTIAALAVWHTLGFLENRVPAADFSLVALLVWVLTLGFMLIAGAFGLWAIQFAAREESRRSIGRMVNAMDYLQDGLLAVDRRQRVSGSNPAARSLAGRDIVEGCRIEEAFTCISAEDVAELLQLDEPRELARSFSLGADTRTLRFRSQPAGNVSMILISDVTVLEARRLRLRQTARLQLIGQIARGVAYDFNNLLCAISGHASLLSRLPPGSQEMKASVDAIARGVEKGSTLAGHLLELVKPVSSLSFTHMGRDYVENAANALQDSLPDEWKVDAEVQDLPAVAMTGLQLEQVVLQLGLIAADASPRIATVYVRASTAGDGFPFDVESRYAAAIVIAAVDPSAVQTARQRAHDDFTESGVILSVVRSMIEEAGGRLESMTSPDGAPIYRIALPFAATLGDSNDVEIPADLGPYIADWTVLLGKPKSAPNDLEALLAKFGVNVLTATSIVSVLAHVESATQLDAVILDRRMILQETTSLLKAILKLCPAAGIVVLCEDPTSIGPELTADIVFAHSHTPPNRMILAVIESRSLALKRRTR